MSSDGGRHPVVVFGGLLLRSAALPRGEGRLELGDGLEVPGPSGGPSPLLGEALQAQELGEPLLGGEAPVALDERRLDARLAGVDDGIGFADRGGFLHGGECDTDPPRPCDPQRPSPLTPATGWE